jgi:hypothetical protein
MNLSICRDFLGWDWTSWRWGCRGEERVRAGLVGFPRRVDRFRPWLRGSWRTARTTPPSCCTKKKISSHEFIVESIWPHLCEWSHESPQPTESTRLQEMQWLLRRIFRSQHVLDNTLNSCQHNLVIWRRQDIVDFLIEKRVTEEKRVSVAEEVWNLMRLT